MVNGNHLFAAIALSPLAIEAVLGAKDGFQMAHGNAPDALEDRLVLWPALTGFVGVASLYALERRRHEGTFFSDSTVRNGALLGFSYGAGMVVARIIGTTAGYAAGKI